MLRRASSGVMALHRAVVPAAGHYVLIALSGCARHVIHFSREERHSNGTGVHTQTVMAHDLSRLIRLASGRNGKAPQGRVRPVRMPRPGHERGRPLRRPLFVDLSKVDHASITGNGHTGSWSNRKYSPVKSLSLCSWSAIRALCSNRRR
jgi:hypothetical protein